MSPIDLLCDKAFGFKELAPEERDAIMHFCLLWGYFEGQALDNCASSDKIIELAREWERQGRLNVVMFDKDFVYFRERYFQNGIATHHFYGLFREDKDQKALALVQSVLKGENTNNGDRIATLLLIIYRLRNRLMHGDKWDEGLNGQRDNFRHANAVLMSALEEIA